MKGKFDRLKFEAAFNKANSNQNAIDITLKEFGLYKYKDLLRLYLFTTLSNITYEKLVDAGIDKTEAKDILRKMNHRRNRPLPSKEKDYDDKKIKSKEKSYNVEEIKFSQYSINSDETDPLLS